MGKDFLKSSLELCNTWGKISSVLFIIILIIGLVYLLIDGQRYKQITGVVKEVKKDGCVTKERVVNTARRSRVELYSDCYLTVEYNVDGKKIVHDLHTEDVEHKSGESIKLEYNLNNPKIIRVYNGMYYYLKWICLIFLILVSITLYLRIYHSDNKYVESFIAISCLDSIFSRSYY